MNERRNPRVMGVFRSLLTSSVRPIEIGRKLIRSIESQQTISAEGKRIAPNIFSVCLNEVDRSAFGDLEKALVAELVDAAKQYVADEGFLLLGDVSVTLVTDAVAKRGKCEVKAEVRPSASRTPEASIGLVQDSDLVASPPTVATPSIPPIPAPVAPTPEKKAVLVLGDGSKISLKPGVVSIGRSAESTIPLNDTNVSRKHAEIRSRGEGSRIEWFVIDLGSTNGTMLNGVKLNGEHKMKNGDSLMFGGTSARFEVS